MTELQKYIAKNSYLEVLPDNSQWTNRFEIKSESSNRIYIVAQKISDKTWGCSCMGWRRYRKCKHLDTIQPILEQAEQAIAQL